MKTIKSRAPLLLIGLYLVISTIAGWCGKWGGVSLLDDPENWRYFTNLSNTFMGLAALILVICVAWGKLPRAVMLLEYAAVTGVFLTLVTVILFLAPLEAINDLEQSLRFYFTDSMLLFHLLNPIAGVVMFVFLLRVYPLKKKELVIGVLPMLLYGTLYTVLYLCDVWPDFYGFTFGIRALIPVAFIVMCGGTLGLAALLRLWHNRFCAEKA